MLESDNFHDDPHNSLAQLSSKAKLPTFAETSDGKVDHRFSATMCFVVPMYIAYVMILCVSLIVGRKRKKTRSNADHFKQVEQRYSCSPTDTHTHIHTHTLCIMSLTVFFSIISEI